jgi:hypothetical protein
MENTSVYKPEPGTIAWGNMIEKVHNCADCPIRKMAMKQPHSIFARLHAWHKTWWPAWKTHQARTCAYAAAARAGMQAHATPQ